MKCLRINERKLLFLYDATVRARDLQHMDAVDSLLQANPILRLAILSPDSLLMKSNSFFLVLYSHLYKKKYPRFVITKNFINLEGWLRIRSNLKVAYCTVAIQEIDDKMYNN